MYQEIIDRIKPELDKVISFLRNELIKMHISRPSASLIEDINVDYFGKKVPLRQLGTISIPNPREIVIHPWDESYTESIQKAISRSPLGVSVIIEKDLIRVSFPSLSEEHRKNLVKVLSQKAEESKKIVRHWRQEAWKEIQGGARTGEIREDDKYRAKDKLQELIDEYNKKIEDMRERKEKEIME